MFSDQFSMFNTGGLGKVTANCRHLPPKRDPLPDNLYLCPQYHFISYRDWLS